MPDKSCVGATTLWVSTPGPGFNLHLRIESWPYRFGSKREHGPDTEYRLSFDDQ